MKIGSIAFVALLKVASVVGANNYYQCTKQNPCDECEIAKDCDTDKECKPGLQCADAHQNELKYVGLDPRKANCEDILYPYGCGGYGKPDCDLGPAGTEVCFDPCSLTAPGDVSDWETSVTSGGGDWDIYGDKVKFNFQDSYDCDYKGSPHSQSAHAEAYINAGCGCGGYIKFSLDGYVECKKYGFDRIEVLLDGQMVLAAMSKDGTAYSVAAAGEDDVVPAGFCNYDWCYPPKKCKMCEPHIYFDYLDHTYSSKGISVDGGMHHIEVIITTGDGALHDGAFYSLDVEFHKKKYGCGYKP